MWGRSRVRQKPDKFNQGSDPLGFTVSRIVKFILAFRARTLRAAFDFSVPKAVGCGGGCVTLG